MSWSIAEVSRMSGVTSRTLRHYDAVGLLPPAYVASSGLRYYGEPELLRLQQILLLRELGLGLQDIASALEDQADQVAVLREHRRRLLAERDRLTTLARTVDRTIAELETSEDGKDDMPKINRPDNLFEGFDTSGHDTEARESWPEQWEQSRQATETLSPADTERMQRETTARIVRMAELMAAGKPVEDAAVQEEVELHYQEMCRFWTPNAAAFKNLGQTYVDDAPWREAYETVATGLATYQRDAMVVYADTRLS